ncbi:hypothetical protein BOX15_Mlig007844g1, partial [Macrostomum lignano]
KMSKRNVSNIENVPAPAGPSAKAPRIASGGNSMSEYERARLQRINENQALLGNLNIALPRFKPTPAPVKLRVRPLPTTTSSTSNVGIDEEYQPPSAKQPRRASVRRAPKRRSARIAAADRIKRASTNSLDGDVLLPPSPKRRSRRIGAMAPNSAALGETASTSDSADEAESESDDEPERGRLDLASELADLLAQVKPFSSDNDEEDKNKAKNKTHANGFTTNNMRFLCSMRPLQKRIFSLALRDDGTAQQPLLGAAGDTKGTIGLFALTNNNESDAVLTGRLHTDRVTELVFGPGDASHLLFTASYDGLVRFVDLNACIGDEISDELRNERFGATALACLPAGGVAQVGEGLAVGGEDGLLRILDRRTGKFSELTANCCRRVVKCIDPHPGPGRGHLCLTACLDGSVNLWDLRSTKEPLGDFSQGRSADSAYWSPTGDMRFLTTSLNDTVRVYDADSGDGEPLLSISHDNFTTRYLSNFRAIWCPSGAAGDSGPIAIGSMYKQQRRIEIYSPESGRLIDCVWDENLTTVTSLVRWQKSRGILCGGNSSGKVFVFGQAA